MGDRGFRGTFRDSLRGVEEERRAETRYSEATQVLGDDGTLMLERLEPVTYLAVTVQTRLLGKHQVLFDDTQIPVVATILTDEIKTTRVVEKKGIAKEESESFKRGKERTMYRPLVLRLVAAAKDQLYMPSEPSIKGPFFFEVNDLVVLSPTFDLVKVELGILMQQAADRAFGLSIADRRQIKNYVDTEVMGKDTWNPDGDNDPAATDPAAKALCRALLDKAQEIVNIQSDQGKVWRNRSTVEHIRKGALTVAASYNRVILGLIKQRVDENHG